MLNPLYTTPPPPLGVEPISGTLFKRDPGGLGGTVLTLVLPRLILRFPALTLVLPILL